MTANSSKKERVDYIDWLRGFAVVGMFEVHCYDAWLGGAARQSNFFHWSQLSGTLPAPLFIFLSGITFALIVTSMRRKGADANQVSLRLFRRGAEVLGLGLLFRVQEFVLGQPWAPPSDLARVDVLNLIGVAMMMMAVAYWIARRPLVGTILAAVIATAIAMATPLLWTTHQPRWLPWYLESYINGVHNLGAPQPWLFPIFPWAAFSFAGLVAGFFLFGEWASAHRTQSLVIIGVAAVAACYISEWFDSRPQIYAVYDYWHTSPAFFLARVGIVMGVIFLGYAWCRWGLADFGFSPLKQLGQTSLLVYWVHIEFVYGRFAIMTQQAQSILSATMGLIVITVAMVLLSILRTKTKGRSGEILAWIRRRPQTAASD